MASSRRLTKELADIQKSQSKHVRNIEVPPDNLLKWSLLLLPDHPPYNKGAFQVDINFPAEYPFKPPNILFRTRIYHPNIDEKGQVCLPLIQAENWKPATKTDQILQALLALIHDPEPDHPLRSEVAEEFTKDRKTFLKKAEEQTRKHAERRPAD